MTTRLPVIAVVALSALTVVATALLDPRVTPAERDAALMSRGLDFALIGTAIVLIALPVLWRHPRHVVGWVLALTGLVWAADGLGESWASYGLAAEPDLPLTGFAVWFVAQFGASLLIALPAVLVLYPHGRVLPGRWGVVSRICLVMACTLPVLLGLAPAAVFEADGAPLPVPTGMPELPVDADAYRVALHVGRALTFLAVPLSLVVAWVRFRSATGEDAVRMRWLLWAGVMCLALTGLTLTVPTGWLTSWALLVALLVTSVSVTVGICRPYVTDVDALMGGTLVYAAVAACVVALDLALVAVLSATVGERLTDRDVTLLVLLVAVAAYGPVRTWVGGVVHRVLVGRRGDRYAVVSGLAARLEESGDVRAQLPALAAEVAETFKLGFVRVEVLGHGGGTLSATHGRVPAATREVPIRYGEELVGRLVLPEGGLRSMLSRRDQRLLFDVVRQAAMAVRSARLVEELQASRERLVLDREEDRRRIRRDLHDGLGPVLGGVAMRLDAVGNSLEHDPATARRMVAQSRADITEALADVRRLVHGLRPPALDDLGLLDALRQQVDRTRSLHLEVDLDARDLPPLPAAVEVAAYRIVSEALTNTVRHARARTCSLRLVEVDGHLLVEAYDDGGGIAPEVAAGVGLRSIRERAAELGGRTEITCPPDGGTRVRAWLPLAKEPA